MAFSAYCQHSCSTIQFRYIQTRLALIEPLSIVVLSSEDERLAVLERRKRECRVNARRRAVTLLLCHSETGLFAGCNFLENFLNIFLIDAILPAALLLTLSCLRVATRMNAGQQRNDRSLQ